MLKIQKQPIMLTVLYALAPLGLAGIYWFGWRVLLIYAVVFAFGFLSEALMARYFKMNISTSLFVSCGLYALSLPPSIPLWIAAVGIVFGIVFGKMVFGGFGKNVFNPAITGRAFIYISFGVPMTSQFLPTAPAAHGAFPGGFGVYLPQVDSVGAATPLAEQASGTAVPFLDLFFGTVPGSIGETSALLVILAGAYIIYKKAANWRLTLSSAAAFLVLQSLLFFAGIEGAVNPIYALVSGSFLLAAFFMITDPISASQSTNLGRWIYGAAFGLLTVTIRVFSNWPEAVSFAILLVNMFAPLLDHLIKMRNTKKKEAAS